MRGRVTTRAVGARVELQASAAQQWVHLMPIGTWSAADGRGPFLMNDPDAVITASIGGGRPLPVDFDHAMEFAAPRGEPAPAAGWFERLEARADGIWALVDWTERAGAALKAREYRYLSPVFEHDKQGRVLRVVRAGLTNDPAFTQLAAVAAREQSMDLDKLLAELRTALGMPERAAGLDPVADAKAVTAAAKTAATGLADLREIAKGVGLEAGANRAQVVAAVASHAVNGVLGDLAKSAGLGLPETAKAEEIVTAVAALKAGAGASPDPSKYVPIAEHAAVVARVTKLEQDDAADKATAAVDAAVKAGKITPAGRDWALGYAAKDPAGFEAFAKNQPVVVAPGELERLGGKPPGGGGDAVDIWAKAAAYQAEQLKAGINVSTAAAVRHVTKGAAA